MKQHDLTIEDLEELMRWRLTEDGQSPEYIAGYIEAQKKSGWLRANAPAWIRNSAGVFYALPPVKRTGKDR